MDESIVVIVRSVIAFSSLLLFTRILGKQQVGELSTFEYISGITIGSIAATLSVDIAIKPLPQFIGLATWVGLALVLQLMLLKFRWFGKVIYDQPTIVIQDGKILEKNLRKLRLRYESLLSELREKNVFDITQVEYCLLEPNGELTILKKAEYEPVTPKDLNIPTKKRSLTTEVIIDGIIIDENLKDRNKTHEWLEQKLQANGIINIKEVAFAAILPNDDLYVDKFKDSISEIDIGDFKGPF